ncbi:hypothetical protein DPEC_G00294640 [Dallia pectoralis]|uniref:Uncharacterized protein n=1 Tax=Dallia pectoralis TaxID=75939 RepID=A0ACC2FIL7_DALPE|nr:hypothetical protein DPEC_G00294640 [Dallia pectoralis]
MKRKIRENCSRLTDSSTTDVAVVEEQEGTTSNDHIYSKDTGRGNVEPCVNPFCQATMSAMESECVRLRVEVHELRAGAEEQSLNNGEAFSVNDTIVLELTGCSFSTQKQLYLSFHYFPVDPNLKPKWIQAIRREEGNRCDIKRGSTYVCSRHFAPDDYVGGCVVRRLKSGVVPNLYPWNNFTAPLRSESVYDRTFKRQSIQLCCEDSTMVAKAVRMYHDYVTHPPADTHDEAARSLDRYVNKDCDTTDIQSEEESHYGLKRKRRPSISQMKSPRMSTDSPKPLQCYFQQPNKPVRKFIKRSNAPLRLTPMSLSH